MREQGLVKKIKKPPFRIPTAKPGKPHTTKKGKRGYNRKIKEDKITVRILEFRGHHT